MDKLETAVANWIRAEWLFRASPVAYSGQTQEWFLAACDKLRAALTGEMDIENAVKVIGLPEKYADKPVARLRLLKPYRATKRPG